MQEDSLSASAAVGWYVSQGPWQEHCYGNTGWMDKLDGTTELTYDVYLLQL